MAFVFSPELCVQDLQRLNSFNIFMGAFTALDKKRSLRTVFTGCSPQTNSQKLEFVKKCNLHTYIFLIGQPYFSGIWIHVLFLLALSSDQRRNVSHLPGSNKDGLFLCLSSGIIIDTDQRIEGVREQPWQAPVKKEEKDCSR